MAMYTKRLLVAAGLAVGLYACAVGGGDGNSEDDPMDGVPTGDAAALAEAGLMGGAGGTGLDSGPGGTFSGFDAGAVVDSSVPRDSSVGPVDSGSTGGAVDAELPLGGLGGLLGGAFGGLFGGGDASTP